MTNLLDLVLTGILASSFVALMALGLSLIYRTSGVLNLSQSGLAALGGYMCYALSPRMPMVAAVILAVLITAVVGAAIGLLVEWRLRNQSPAITMVATLAIGIVLVQLLEQIWGADPLFTNVIGLSPVTVGPFHLNRVDVWAAVAAASLAGAVTLALNLTKIGLAMRAVADSPNGARATGIPAVEMRAIGWAVAAALGAVAGFFAATPMGFLSPGFMDLYMVAALIAAVIGGLGNLNGAILGAIVVSVASTVFQAYAPSFTIGSDFIFLGSFTQTFVLLLLILVLLVLPRGLMGSRIGRVV
jgi:branched-subunit amino acid ABC-type transport system permease component